MFLPGQGQGGTEPLEDSNYSRERKGQWQAEVTVVTLPTPMAPAGHKDSALYRGHAPLLLYL